MTTRKRSDPSTTEPAPAASSGRKPWCKNAPVEVCFQQEEKLRAEVEAIEAQFKDKREQLGKFEEARKISETT